MLLGSKFQIGILCSLALVFSPLSATAADQCGFGKTRFWPEDATLEQTTCVTTKWKRQYFDDGFESGILLSMGNDSPDSDGENWEFSENRKFLWITCSNRKLQVSVDAEYPDSYGFNGKGKVKFDSGKPATLNYQVGSPFDSAFINRPASFLKSLAKAKKSVSFSIGTLMGTEITSFPKGDFLTHRTALAKQGCRF